MKEDNHMGLISVATVADYLTIINFVISIFIFVGASISKKLREWVKSILIECTKDYLKKKENHENIDKNT